MTSNPRNTKTLRISEMVATPVACPDPPLLNHHGVHESLFLRVIVRIRTEDGLEGLGEGPGGGLYVQQLKAAAKHVIGADPYQVEALRAYSSATRESFPPSKSRCST